MKFYTNVACQGNHIYYRGVEDGRRVRRKMEYSPTLHIPAKAGAPPSPSALHTLDGLPVEDMHFDSINAARDFVKQYEDVDGFTIYGNSRYEYQLIADQHPEEEMDWSADDIVTAFIDIEVDTEHGMPDVDTAQNEITAITVKFSNDPKYYAFGCKDYTPHRPDIHWLHCTDEVDLLATFMTMWHSKSPDIITGWHMKTFDIPYLVNRMVGLPDFGEEKARWLSPWGRITRKVENYYNKEVTVYHLLGIATLDYLQLFRKYSPSGSQESYKLDHIAFVELKSGKVDYSEYDSLHHLYRDNFQKFMEYNIRDVELVEKLNAKGGLIQMALTLAYDNKTNYEDCFSQVRMWDTICYNELRRKGVVVPPNIHTEKDKAYEGAYVKEPQIGLWEHVAGFDLTGLYPHIIMQYNMSPETLIDKKDWTPAMKQIVDQGVTVDKMLAQVIDMSLLDGQNATMTPNGQFFRKDILGFLPAIMDKMVRARATYKNKQIACQKEKETNIDETRKKELDALISRYKNLQLAKKVGLNSAYGAMGNEFFRFFDIRVAEGVTLAGQLSIRWIEQRVNRHMNQIMKTEGADYIIAGDTDSIYLHMGPLVQKVCKDLKNTKKVIDFMDTACQKEFGPFIDKSYQDLANYVRAYAQKMFMKREALADKAIWTAKKRYILNIWDNEGVRYKEPDIKVQGLEMVKSSTPSACRQKMKDALKIIMNGTEAELIDFIKKFRVEFETLPIQEIAFPRGLNGLIKYSNLSPAEQSPPELGWGETAAPPSIGGRTDRYLAKCPIHVKGAIAYNYYLEQMGIIDDYESIRNGDKVKFVHLKTPNPFFSPVMSFITRIPKEFALETVIDYRLQFQKSFIDPLNIILKCIGWESEKSATLEDFFG